MLDVAKAARIKQTFEEFGEKGQGAYGLDGAMIDAPVYKQVCTTLSHFHLGGDLVRTQRRDDVRS
jgi:citrate lyase subunit beta-like protein